MVVPQINENCANKFHSDLLSLWLTLHPNYESKNIKER